MASGGFEHLGGRAAGFHRRNGGVAVEAIEAAFDTLRSGPLADMWDGLPGGEPIRDFHDRVIGGLHRLLDGFDVRQTGYHPLTRPQRAHDGRWTVDAWAPTDGFVVNGGVRFRF